MPDSDSTSLSITLQMPAIPASAERQPVRGSGKPSRRVLEAPLPGPHESEACDRHPASPQSQSQSHPHLGVHKIKEQAQKPERKQDHEQDDATNDPSERDTTLSSGSPYQDDRQHESRLGSRPLVRGVPHPDPEPEHAVQQNNNNNTTMNKEQQSYYTAGPDPGQKPKTDPAEILKLTKKITQHPTLTPLRKTLYLCLLDIPPGDWTTYTALAKHTNSSARAVGTAMRCNPFAPGVPCHRVLGGDGGLGGYMGTKPVKEKKRGKEGKGVTGNLEKKRRMLEDEGVRFDARGRAMGRVFVGFSVSR